MTATIVDRLDPSELPVGRLSKLQVELVHDGLGRAIRLPVLAARGRKPGPVLGITAALHGDELNGIPVVQQLLRSIDLDQLRGTVVGVVVVNIPGLLANQRSFMSTWDLNHRFPGKAKGDASEVYVHRLMDRIVRHFEIFADLHTASFGRVNSLYVRADMTDEGTAQMAYLQRPQIIVHNPPNDKTLRGRAAALGIPSITVEIGDPQRYQARMVKRARQGLRAVMAANQMLRSRPLATPSPPILCRSSRWMYTGHGGLLSVKPGLTDHVTKGDVVAEMVDPWGDLVATYKAPQDGVVIGHSVNPVSPTGARILHLGRYATEADPFIRQEGS